GGQARGYDVGKKTTGRKRHITVDAFGLLLVATVTSASVQRPARRPEDPAVSGGAVSPSIGLVWVGAGQTDSIDNTHSCFYVTECKAVRFLTLKGQLAG